jgi:hypothetical protein
LGLSFTTENTRLWVLGAGDSVKVKSLPGTD